MDVSDKNESFQFRLSRKMRDYYLALYTIAVDEVHKYHNLHHQRVLYFSGLVTTMMGGLSLAIIKSTHWSHYAFVAVGLVLLIQVCQIGRVGISGAYRLLLEAISTRAKLEQALGFTSSDWNSTPRTDTSFWHGEGLVPTRHLEDRIRFAESSLRWQDHFLGEGDQRWPVRFLNSTEALAVVLLLIVALLTLKLMLTP